jgi:hypothetical protein
VRPTFHVPALRTTLSLVLACALALESCATGSHAPHDLTWRPVDTWAGPDVNRTVMQRAPVAIVEASLAEPDPLEAAPPGVVRVRLTVRNVGTHSLQVRSNQSELDLADGRRLETSHPPRPPAEAPPAAASAAEDAKASTLAPKGETAKKAADGTAKVLGGAGALAAATVVRAAAVVFMPVLVVVAVATSPIWGPFALVAIHKDRASLRAALDAGLQGGDVALAAGESASAVIEFVDAGVDDARPRAEFVVVRVTDHVGRDWTATLRIARPK